MGGKVTSGAGDGLQLPKNSQVLSYSEGDSMVGPLVGYCVGLLLDVMAIRDGSDVDWGDDICVTEGVDSGVSLSLLPRHNPI